MKKLTPEATTNQDFGLLICRWAERKARLAKMPVWAKVQEITGTGATLAARFCAEHLPKLGWSSITPDAPTDDRLVLTAEDLGDSPRKLKRVGGQWYDKNGNIMCYSPSWWKEIK